MELTHDERRLLDEFRSLTSEGRAELMDYAAFLLKKHRASASSEVESTDNQCHLDKREERPEAAKEPIFTE